MKRKLISVSVIAVIALIVLSTFASAVSIPASEGIPEVTASPHSGTATFKKESIPDVAASPSSGIVFDTGAETYPSIMGTHRGHFTPKHDITVSRMYTYPCKGTGGHTEYVAFYYQNDTEIVNGSWKGYQGPGDYYYIEFDKPFTLHANVTYGYKIITGSYPQMHHSQNVTTSNGTITCTEFVDANGKRYEDWIPAIWLISGLSISFYEAYDNDDFAQSNPMEDACIETYFVNDIPIFEATVAVRVTLDGEPANNTNVSLNIWNPTYQKVLMANTNDLGYSTFFLLGQAVSSEYWYYWYQAYITDNPTISTEVRKIIIRKGYASQTLGDTVNKSVTLEKIEIIRNESLEGKPIFLRYIYFVTSKKTIDDYYTVTVSDYFGNITYNLTEPIHLEANTPKTVFVDIPVITDANATNIYQYQVYNVTFKLHDPVLLYYLIVIGHWILANPDKISQAWDIISNIPDAYESWRPHKIPPPAIPEPNTLVITLITLLCLIGYAISIKKRSKR